MGIIRDYQPQPQDNILPLEEAAEDLRKPKKRALLVGVEYMTDMTLGKELVLEGSHKDVAAMKNLLIEKYDYNPNDIVVLIDTMDPNQKRPTRDNLIAEMKDLVRGAASGDRFFLHYSGHATQVPNKDKKEEDDMDECIVPCDSTLEHPNLIKDDLMREILVDKLPAGSHLVAIFDACHSASLLDLKHFRCNRVYVPWKSKGRRRSNSRWLPNVRHDAALINTQIIRRRTRRTSKNIVRTRRMTVNRAPCLPSQEEEQLVPPAPASHGTERPQEQPSFQPTCHALPPSRPQRPVIKTEGISLFTKQSTSSKSNTKGRRRRSKTLYQSSSPNFFGDYYPGQSDIICESPVEEFCTGNCRETPSPIVGRRPTLESANNPVSVESPLEQLANVMSLGSCEDSQLTWEDAEGHSMTQMVVDLLSRDPHPTLSDFMIKLSHTMHDRYLHMHRVNKEYKQRKKRWRSKKSRKASPEGDTNGAEISNFQDPQLSSHKPLDMDSRLDL
ncbi:hypothetical protein AAF712_012976 [Marasmius tenuissimus]|uniref:Peptidase C14 caspase domain-containing protein n=1 Tax=Marasmius tenuissimus TaxID=585030 RepID=A0ABR2ZF95_9AGAR